VKKLSLLILGAIIACTLSTSVFAAGSLNLTTGFVKNYWVNTFTFPVSTDIGLRTGLGLYVDSNRWYLPEAKVGLIFPNLWDLFVDFDFGDLLGTNNNIFSNYSISLGKKLSFKLTDQITLGAEIVIFKYGYFGTVDGIVVNKHSFQLLSEIQPQLGFNINF
jgi:hypothetical protein